MTSGLCMVKIDLVKLSDWLNLSDEFSERMQLIYDIIDNASPDPIRWVRIVPGTTGKKAYADVSLTVIRSRSKTLKLKRNEIDLLMSKIEEFRVKG